VFSQDKVETLLLLLFPVHYSQTPNHNTFVNAFVLDPHTENIYGAKFNASQGMTDDQIEKARSAKKIVLSDDDWELMPESQTADGVIAEYKMSGEEIDRAIAEDIAHERFIDFSYRKAMLRNSYF
jgi:hypothetical protein